MFLLFHEKQAYLACLTHGLAQNLPIAQIWQFSTTGLNSYENVMIPPADFGLAGGIIKFKTADFLIDFFSFFHYNEIVKERCR